MSGAVHRPAAVPVLCLIALSCALASGASVPAPATEESARSADWIFRGNAELTGVVEAELDGALAPAWLFEAGEDGVETTPAVSGDTAYVTALDGKLYAIDLETGKGKWTYDAGEEVKSSPTVYRGLVLFGDGRGVFHAVDARTGERRWSFEAGAEINSSANFSGDRLVFGSNDNSLYALAVKDGALLWRVETDGYVFGTPTIVGDRVISAGCDGVLRVLSLSDGSAVSTVELGAYVGASPAYREGRVYMGTFENQIVAVSLADAAVAWRYENPDRKFPYLSSAAVTDHVVVVGGRDKLVHALDPATGEARWTHNAGARVDSSPIISGGRVFVGSSRGLVLALDEKTGVVEWSFDTGAPVVGAPGLAGSRLLVANSDGQVYCFKPAAPVQATGQQRSGGRQGSGK